MVSFEVQCNVTCGCTVLFIYMSAYTKDVSLDLRADVHLHTRLPQMFQPDLSARPILSVSISTHSNIKDRAPASLNVCELSYQGMPISVSASACMASAYRKRARTHKETEGGRGVKETAMCVCVCACMHVCVCKIRKYVCV